jgi:hypothetical protein
MASERGDQWEEIARFSVAYCVELEDGTVVAVFPL